MAILEYCNFTKLILNCKRILCNNQMQNKVLVGYWKIRGLAERIRFLLEYLGIAYEQEQYDTNFDDWFKVRKPQLHKKNPAITLPFLVDGDKVVSESDAIIVYLIHKAGKLELLGRNLDEQVQLATAYGVFRDLHREYISFVYGKSQKSIEEDLKQTIPKFTTHLNKLNGLLGKNNFFAGNITYFDLIAGEFFQILFKILAPELKTQFENLVQFQERVWALPAIQKYVKSERFHERPCNGATARWR